jgi:hypothetical protein
VKELLFRKMTGLSAAKTLGNGLSVPTDVAIAAGGDDYVVNDIVTLAGGTFAAPSTCRVAAVNSDGTVTRLEILLSGVATTKPSNPVAVTGGTGTGLTLTVTWRDNSIPEGTRFATIQPEGQPVRWRGDGTAPDATTGQLLAVGASKDLAVDSIGSLQVIETTATATLNVSFFG